MKFRAIKLVLAYAAAFLQGVFLLLIPAGGPYFKSTVRSVGLTDAQYGSLFLTLIAGAILATFGFDRLRSKFGKLGVYWLGVGANVVFALILSMLAFTGVQGNAAGYGSLLTANAFLGFGFGMFISALNLMVIDMFPDHRNAAVTGLHSLLGTGSAVAPLFLNYLMERNFWGVLPVAGILLIVVLGITESMLSFDAENARLEKENGFVTESGSGAGHLTLGAFGFMAAVFLYGICESMIGNWSTFYLIETKGFSDKISALALSLFWGFVTAGRILAALLTLKVDARIFYRISPWIVLLGLLLLLRSREESDVPLCYALLGLGCSYFFPLTVSLATHTFDSYRQKLTAWIVAGLMAGVGVGSCLVGWLKNQSLLELNQSFHGAAVCMLVLAVISFFVTRRREVKRL